MIFGPFLTTLIACNAVRPIINPGLRFAVRLDAIPHQIPHLNIFYPRGKRDKDKDRWRRRLHAFLCGALMCGLRAPTHPSRARPGHAPLIFDREVLRALSH